MQVQLRRLKRVAEEQEEDKQVRGNLHQSIPPS